MTTVTATTIRQTIKAGSYVCVDVSQTKDKGLAICRLTVADGEPIGISYFHQPFPHTEITGDDVHAMVDRWPDELLSASCYSIDSPLAFAHGPDGRHIDRKSTWIQLGFADYLNKEPQKAPTEVDGEDAEKRWVRVGMWLRECLEHEVIEVYPTAAFNGLNLWVRDGINLVEWFAAEPDSYGFIADGAQIESFQLRFLERLRVAENYGTRHTRFRKLSAWPYPDLWDAFGGAITTAFFCSGLTEKVEAKDAKDEGSIVVPMRLGILRTRVAV